MGRKTHYCQNVGFPLSDPLELLKLRALKTQNTTENVEQCEVSFIVCRSSKWYILFRRQVGGLFKKKSYFLTRTH
jgi:hypothetical protein